MNQGKHIEIVIRALPERELTRPIGKNGLARARVGSSLELWNILIGSQPQKRFRHAVQIAQEYRHHRGPSDLKESVLGLGIIELGQHLPDLQTLPSHNCTFVLFVGLAPRDPNGMASSLALLIAANLLMKDGWQTSALRNSLIHWKNYIFGVMRLSGICNEKRTSTSYCLGDQVTPPCGLATALNEK
jgi:hypothetical protein